MKTYKCSEKVRENARKRMAKIRRERGIKPKPTFEERFWGKCKPGPGGCRLWQGHVGHSGHGQVYYNGRVQRAHRVAWIERFGPIPEGICVLHRCDVPSCVNVDHLFLGSQSENMEDMLAKSRNAKGSGHGAAKLTEKKVRQILADTRGPSKIAIDYGISASTVCDIRAKRSWAHVQLEQVEEMAGVMVND